MGNSMTAFSKIISIFSFLFLIIFGGCIRSQSDEPSEDIIIPSHGLFICCEGNYQYGNATLSFYDPITKEVQNDIFRKSNSFKLGDVVQSMTMYGDRAWIIVNNSHVMFSVNPNTCQEIGRITGFTSPRYVCFISEEKAYVSQLWDNRIFIINPRNYSVTGYIDIPDMTMQTGSTEQMVLKDGYVYCTCWSYQNRVIKIDSKTDEVVSTLEVGSQPTSIVVDKNGYLWTLTDGGFDGSETGQNIPQLVKINTSDFTIAAIYKFDIEDSPSELNISGDGETLYWLNDDVWSLSVDNSDAIPVKVVDSKGTLYYGLTVSPDNGDIYVADAVDYQQNGTVYRYSGRGELIDYFTVGVTPGAFCWK